MPSLLSTWNASIYSSGLSSPNYNPTAGPQSTPAVLIPFEFARFYNSDPSNATYSWSSPKLYNAGWVATGTDSLGPYLNIADGPNGASDNGRIILASSPQNSGVVEFRTTNAGGHGLKTGQWVQINGGGITLPWTIRGNQTVFTNFVQSPVFVTSSSTLAISWNFGSGSGSLPDTINSTTEIPISGFSLSFQCPLGNIAPVEYFCSFINRLPNCDYWHNAPPLGRLDLNTTDGYHYRDGFTAGTILGPTHGVRFEYNNEWWNTGNRNTHFFLPVQANFSAYSSAVPIYGGWFTGRVLTWARTRQPSFFSAIATAFTMPFKAGWVAAGRSPKPTPELSWYSMD